MTGTHGGLVLAAALALAGRAKKGKHGQVCPVWTTARSDHPAPTGACECWVLSNALDDAPAVVDAVLRQLDAAALRAQVDAVRALCDAQGEDSYVLVRVLRAVLASVAVLGSPENTSSSNGTQP